MLWRIDSDWSLSDSIGLFKWRTYSCLNSVWLNASGHSFLIAIPQIHESQTRCRLPFPYRESKNLQKLKIQVDNLVYRSKILEWHKYKDIAQTLWQNVYHAAVVPKRILTIHLKCTSALEVRKIISFESLYNQIYLLQQIYWTVSKTPLIGFQDLQKMCLKVMSAGSKSHTKCNLRSAYTEDVLCRISIVKLYPRNWSL